MISVIQKYDEKTITGHLNPLMTWSRIWVISRKEDEISSASLRWVDAWLRLLHWHHSTHEWIWNYTKQFVNQITIEIFEKKTAFKRKMQDCVNW